MATAIGYSVHQLRDPELHHHHAGLHAVAVVCAMSGVVLICTGHPDAPTDLAVASVSSATVLEQPGPSDALDEHVVALESGIADAESALTESQGRVLDEGVRTELAELVGEGRSSVRRARLLMAMAAPGAMPDPASAPGDAESTLAAELEAEIAAVGEAVTAWEAEQARIAAEREAARLAAEAAARAQSRAHVRTAGAVVAPGPYVEGIWTSGGQAEIDACRGSVNLPDVAGYLGGSFYAAEHWSCGGRSWSGIGTGELVSFPGYGIFQVTGRVGGLPSGSSASALPAGYDGYYQTCMNGNVNNLHVWLLTRVG